MSCMTRKSQKQPLGATTLPEKAPNANSYLLPWLTALTVLHCSAGLQVPQVPWKDAAVLGPVDLIYSRTKCVTQQMPYSKTKSDGEPVLGIPRRSLNHLVSRTDDVCGWRRLGEVG